MQPRMLGDIWGAGALIMEKFSKHNSADRFFLPKTDSRVRQGMRRGAVFFESELVFLSAHLVSSGSGISHRNGVLKYRSRDEISYQLIHDHASGRADSFV